MDVDEDVRTMVERNSVAAEDAGTELLLADYFVSPRTFGQELAAASKHFLPQRLRNFRIKDTCLLQEEDSSSLMDKDRRKQAVRVKVRRLSDGIARARKDREGPAGSVACLCLSSPSSSSPSALSSCPHGRSGEADEDVRRKPVLFQPEEPGGDGAAAGRGKGQRGGRRTEDGKDSEGCCCCPQLSLKLDLLQATHYKLSTLLSQLDGTPRPPQPCRNISIRKWKDKVGDTWTL